MAFFDFFKRHKKTKTEIVKITDPSPEHTLFSETVMEIIGPAIEQFGFSRHSIEVEKYFTVITYRRNKQYIKIKASTFPTDYPDSYNIVLGNGDSEDFFEYDWNSVALWRLINKIDPASNAKEYAFPAEAHMKFSLSGAGEELIKYADTFLHGDLALFLETRCQQNRNREPYKIYTPDKSGKYVTTYDPVSAKQKKKYS